MRSVSENTLTSLENPDIRISVDESFRYLGAFDFELNDIVAGERYVFVDETDGKVNRLFVFQFEQFLRTNDQTYNYSFSSAEDIGGLLFRQNTWAYSNADAHENSPDGEGSLTAQFIRTHGLELEDQLTMSRFLTVPDDDRRHEMILFYLENASSTGFDIATFYDAEDNPTPHWLSISEGLTERSRSVFHIED